LPSDISQYATELTAVMYKESDVSKHEATGRIGIKTINTSLNGNSSNVTFEDIWNKHSSILYPYKIYSTGHR